jgi:predicted transcriptional regulator
MNQQALLLSVAPEFAEQIAAGSKTVELRRRFAKVPTGTWIYFYVTLPVGAVTGRAKVVDIDIDAPSALWARHHLDVGLSQARFRAYFSDCETGCAVSISDYEPIEPISLSELRSLADGFAVPQSYRFLNEDLEDSLVRGQR